MQIRPNTVLTPIRSQAPVAAPLPPAKPLPKETFFQHAQEEVADVAVALGRVPLLGKIGIWLYGLIGRPTDKQAPLSNLGTLAPGLMRGAQPTTEGFAQLASQGIKTVINLRPEYPQEADDVRKAGLHYVYLPLPPIGAPSLQQGLKFLSLATDPANGPVFFHCQHGADRTGAMAAIYRIAHDGWTAEQAIAEMPGFHFHQGIEDEKLDFVRRFERYWKALPTSDRARIMHTGLSASA